MPLPIKSQHIGRYVSGMDSWASMSWFPFGVEEQWQSDKMSISKSKSKADEYRKTSTYIYIYKTEADGETKHGSFNFRVAKSSTQTPRNSGCS